MEIRGFDLGSTMVMRPVQATKKTPERKDAAPDAVQESNKQESVALSSGNPDKAQGVFAEEKASLTAKSAELKEEDERASQAKKKAEEETKLLDKNFTKAYFAVDDKTDSVVIRIVDREGKLLRQIPPEDYLKMLQTMKKNVESIFSTKA
ncbi:MAG: flagellar protein FlaG [Magnetococcales bacterium]|uniref:Flagellar protein FlaG n=1 Tax=Candidatus Magnetobacterium casense TaxID=1455061 RepID=A0ABS6S1S3_9BACT|nr:flagellar protein FlaG [Candidatus Magnetobacterium casensis]MBF0606391.1 flagellar protein FlaG [Nitrospirota bacterium]MBV6342793.1 flagellar protein FlaG [Candidatus Magnetobacterium casensis]